MGGHPKSLKIAKHIPVKHKQTAVRLLIAEYEKFPGSRSVYKSKDPSTASTSTRRSVVRSIAYRNASGSWAIAGQVL